MSNRTFLYLWFPLSWIITAGIAVGVFWLLRNPFLGLANRFGRAFRRSMKVLFPAGIALPAFAGFLSVSYFGKGCGRYTSSADVIADTEHLHHVAELEVRSSADWLIVALLVWAVLYTILVIAWKKSHPVVGAGSSLQESDR